LLKKSARETKNCNKNQAPHLKNAIFVEKIFNFCKKNLKKCTKYVKSVNFVKKYLKKVKKMRKSC